MEMEMRMVVVGVLGSGLLMNTHGVRERALEQIIVTFGDFG